MYNVYKTSDEFFFVNLYTYFHYIKAQVTQVTSGLQQIQQTAIQQPTAVATAGQNTGVQLSGEQFVVNSIAVLSDDEMCCRH